ncbi:hypothetical protein DFH06DRAFT_1352694 [Mycena polygramma]|nr:hypothetical protein DFH06DRAFT_1352694 [Mycena polygramma]
MILTLQLAVLAATTALSATALSISSGGDNTLQVRQDTTEPLSGQLRACTDVCFAGDCNVIPFQNGTCVQLPPEVNAKIASWTPVERDWVCQMWTYVRVGISFAGSNRCFSSDDCGGMTHPGVPQGNLEIGIYPGDQRLTSGLVDQFQSFECYAVDLSTLPTYSQSCEPWPTSTAAPSSTPPSNAVNNNGDSASSASSVSAASVSSVSSASAASVSSVSSASASSASSVSSASAASASSASSRAAAAKATGGAAPGQAARH